MTLRRFVLALLLSAFACLAAQAADHAWLATWAASPQPVWPPGFVLPSGVPDRLRAVSLRQPVRVSIGGRALRIVLSNEYGDRPVVLAAVRVARSTGAEGIDPATDHEVRFGGRGRVTLPPHARLTSDPVPLGVPSLGRIAVTLRIEGAAAPSTFHWHARQTAYLARGADPAAPAWPGAAPLEARVFLAGVDVLAPRGAQAVVALGDSITDGNGTTPDANASWPERLAERLAPTGVAVLNAGISGARLLADGMGVKALDRLDRDALDAPGARTLILMLGTNDIGWPGGPFAPREAPMTADALIAGYRAVIARAHARGLRVIGATLPPFKDALAGTPLEGHYSPRKDATREAVNRWIRESGAFDAVLDADVLLRDPAAPARMLPAYDAGDHLHPGDAGAQALAEAAADLLHAFLLATREPQP